MSDVFISYAREDRSFVQRLTQALSARGRDTWVDWERIEPSDEWWRSVTEAIDRADTLLFVLSPDSLDSDVCKRELDHAANDHKRVIGIVARDVEGLPAPKPVADVNWVFLRDGDDWEPGLGRLERALDLDLDLVRIHTAVVPRARAWDSAGRRPGMLLAGDDLHAAERWLERAAGGAEPQPTELQLAFIRLSRRRAGRRHRIALTGSLIVTVAAVALATFALIQRAAARHEADVARSRELAAQAEAELGSEPEQSVALAEQGIRVSPTGQAIHALADALDSARLRIDLQQSTPVEAIAFSPSGNLLATGGADGSVRLVRLGDRQLIWSRGSGQAPAVRIAFDRSGDLMVVLHSPESAFTFFGDRRCSVTVLSPSTGKVERTLAAGKLGSCPIFAGFVGSSHQVAVGYDNGLVQRWDASNGELVGLITGLTSSTNSFEGYTYGMALSPDGRKLAASKDPLYLRTISLPTEALDGDFSLTGVALKPDAVAFNPQDDREVAAGGKYGVTVSSLPPDQVGPFAAMATFGAIGSVAWDPNGRLLAAGTEAGQTYVWNAHSSRLVERFGAGSAEPINAVAFSSNGQLATGSASGDVQIWAPDPDLPIRMIPESGNAGGFLGGSMPSHNILVLGDATKLFVVNGSGKVISMLTPGGPSGAPIGVAADGAIVVERAHRIEELQFPSWTPTRQSWSLSPNTSPIQLAASADGQTVASANQDGTVTLFRNNSTSTLPSAHPGEGAFSVSLSPNGQWLAVSSEQVETGQEKTLRVFATANPRTPVLVQAAGTASFSPDDRLLAVQRSDLSIELLNTAGWHRQITLQGETSTIDGISFTPDGRILVATALDGTIRAWDVDDGTLLATRYAIEPNLNGGLPTGAQTVSAPAVASSGLVLVGLNTPTNALLEYNVCDQCLDAHALLAQAETHLAANRPSHVG
jgi:WD40 repeat protein